MTCINDSHPASCPTHNSKDPTYEIISLRIDVITTFHAILRKISPTPMGRKPGFLSSGIKRHVRNTSREVECLLVLKVLHKSVELFPKLVDVNKCFQPSLSIPEGPAPPWVLAAVF